MIGADIACTPAHQSGKDKGRLDFDERKPLKQSYKNKEAPDYFQGLFKFLPKAGQIAMIRYWFMGVLSE